jgi:hypothetical protein
MEAYMGTRKDAIALLVRHGVASAESFILLAGTPQSFGGPSAYQAKCGRLRRIVLRGRRRDLISHSAGRDTGFWVGGAPRG